MPPRRPGEIAQDTGGGTEPRATSGVDNAISSAVRRDCTANGDQVTGTVPAMPSRLR